jgi:nitrate/nitrite transporter NarK
MTHAHKSTTELTMLTDRTQSGLAPHDEFSWRYRGWLVSLASMVSLMFGPSTVAILSLGIFIRPLEQSFGWTRAEVAIASSISAYAAMMISPLHGYLVDRFGARKVALRCVPLFGIAVAAMYWLPAVHWIYYLAWALLPVAGLGMFPLSYLRLVSSWFDRRLGRAIGIANAGIGLGSAVLPLLLTGLVAEHGWRVGFLAMAALVLCVSLPATLLFARDPAEATMKDCVPGATDWQGFFKALRTLRFALLALVFALLGLVNTALVVHQIPLLVDAGVSPQRAALVQAVLGIFVIAGRIITGTMIDFVAAPLVMMTWVLGATLSCLMYASGVTDGWIFVCGALIGMLIGAEFDALGYLLRRYFDIRFFGKLHGLIYAVFQFGAGAGAIWLPMMRQASGTYRQGLLVFAGVTMTAAVLLVALHRACGRAADGQSDQHNSGPFWVGITKIFMKHGVKP